MYSFSNSTPSSLAEALFRITAQPARPAMPRKSWEAMNTIDMPASELERLRGACVVIEATDVIEMHDTAVADFDCEPTTQPIPHETCAELVYGAR